MFIKKIFNKLFFVIIIWTVNVKPEFLSQDWQEAESKAQNTVVQVWSQKAEFNWVLPYKSPEQHEVAGTAFFINDQGYLLTNFHVVDQAKSIFINVPFLGRKLLEVSIVGVCPESDIALLKLNEEGCQEINSNNGKIPFLLLGDSDALYPTEPVLALGYPLGQRYMKSTVGVIAGREYINGSSFMHITAPINPGNSGGPLLNIDGKVVGINSAGIKEAQNIGYIVPINDVKIMLDGLYKGGLYRKPYLGISLNHATPEHTNSLNNPLPGGVYINYVQEGSVASKAGICVGDMLYGIKYGSDTYEVDEYGDVTVKWRSSDKISFGELLVRLEVGKPLSLLLFRNGQEIEVNCTFDVPPVYPIRFIYPDYESDDIDYEMFGGVVIMQLRDNHFKYLPPTSLLKQYSRIDYEIKEILVMTCILPGSEMHKVDCFYPGTLVEKINGKEVKNLAQLREALLTSVQTKEIAITTKENVATVLSLNKILKDEPRLARDFRFPITEHMKKMWYLANNKS